MLVNAMRIVSVGEILWDVFPEAEHLGGASFNLAAHARRLGHEVDFVSGVGGDERGRRALARVGELGLSPRFIRVVPEVETGKVTVVLDAAGQPTFTIHRPAAYDFAGTQNLDGLFSPAPEWVAFGTLYQMTPQGRGLVRRVLASAPAASVFYDINLRINSYTPEIVLESLEAASIAKLNDAEVIAVARMAGLEAAPIERFARDLAARFRLRGVTVTLGAKGCALLLAGDYVEVPGYPVRVADTVGAGDAFSAALIHGIGEGWPVGRIADFANRVGALVAGRDGAIPEWTVAEALALTRPQ
jgi:fructokinase